MSVSGAPANDGTPNGKPYVLLYADDGSQYVYRQPGREPQREFTLEAAIMWANLKAGEMELLLVTDPVTNTVLWTGQRITR